MKREAEFFSQIVRTESGCWEWTGSLGQRGYGRFYEDGIYDAHRWMIVFLYGPQPAGVWALHRCDNAKCVSPFHVYLGTPLQNNQDCLDRGRNFWASRTHCSKGHPLTEENTRIVKNAKGQFRRCMTCHRLNNKRLYHESN